MISILIATYNSDRTIRKCLDSLLLQKLLDWECILIDGVSCDDTINIIQEYESKDCRFKHISEPDSGIYDALNKGFKLAKGEWVYVLGSDDWLTKDGLYELQYHAQREMKVVYGNIIVAYNNGVNRVIPPKAIEKIRYYMPISHQGAIVRLEEVERLGGFDLQYVCKGDFNMMQRLYLLGIQFQYVNTNVAYCGMDGLSNKLSSIIKYDWERYWINTRNKSNSIPFISWCWVEFKTILTTFRDKLLKRK